MATTVTWNGSTASFDTAADWSGGVVPGPTNGDVGQIASGTVQIGNETLNGFELLIGNPPVTNAPTLALTNAVFGPALLLQDTTPINGFFVSNVGTTINNGTISLTGGGVDNVNDAGAPSTFVNAIAGTIAVNNTQLDLNTTTLRNDGTVSVANGGGVDIDIANTNTVALTGGGTFSLAGASTVSDAALSTAASLTFTFADATGDVLVIANAGSFQAAITSLSGQNEIDLVNVAAADTAIWANNVLTVTNGGATGTVVATLNVFGNYAAQHFTTTTDVTGVTHVQLAAFDVWNGSTSDFTNTADWSLGAPPSAANGYTGQITFGTVAASGTLDGFGLVIGDPTGTSVPALALTAADLGPNLILQDSASSIGFAISVTASLINDGTIALTGSTDVASIGGASAVSFTNAADGKLSVSAAALNIGALGFIENDATIAVVNGGALGLEFANPGTGTVQGAGTIVLSGGATVEDDAALTTAQTFAFGDTTNDTLRISNVVGIAGVAGFHGTVAGLAVNNVIDLSGVAAATGASWAGGVLSVTNGGSTVANLNLAGSYAGARFLVGSDGAGGTTVQLAATDVWNGSTASFNTAGDWSLGVIPGATNGYTAVIAAGTAQVSGTLDAFALRLGDSMLTNTPVLAVTSVNFGPNFLLTDPAATIGASIAVAGTLVNDGTIALSNTSDVFTVGNAVGGTASAFRNAADGQVSVVGAQFNVNTSLVENDATIAVSNAGGLGIDFNNTGSASLTGTGAFTIATGSTIDDGAATTAQTLTFTFTDTSNDTLVIGNAAGFAGTVAGLAVNNVIDLAGVPTATGATWSGNVLTVTNGASIVASLALAGSYAGVRFLVGSDGAGGTDVQIAPTDIWNGSTASFNTAADWSLGVVPGATNGYTAQIPAGTVQMAGQTIDGIELLIGQPPVTNNPTLALSSTTFGHALLLQDTTPLLGFTVTNAGTSVNHGLFNLVGGGVDNVNDASATSTFVNAADGAINVANGQLDLNTSVVENDGSIAVTAGGALDIDIANSGTVAFQGTGTVSMAGASSVVDAAAGTASGQTFAFEDATNDILTIESTSFNAPSGFSAQIAGFQANNQIDLANVVGDTATWASNVLTVFNGGTTGSVVATLNVVGNYGTNTFGVVSDGFNGVYVSVACFAAGTRIATTRGEIAVEFLVEGDEVVTLLGGATASVRWVGTRRVDIAAHPHPAQVRPVRVRAGALGANVPYRDVRLSPEHAVHLDGVLIPVGLLANGDSIVQEDAVSIRYYHVELDRHDVLLADGLPAESWLDTGNRGIFANAPVASLMPTTFVPDTRSGAWAEQSCAELVTSGERLAAIRARIARTGDTDIEETSRRSA